MTVEKQAFDSRILTMPVFEHYTHVDDGSEDWTQLGSNQQPPD